MTGLYRFIEIAPPTFQEDPVRHFLHTWIIGTIPYSGMNIRQSPTT